MINIVKNLDKMINIMSKEMENFRTDIKTKKNWNPGTENYKFWIFLYGISSILHSAEEKIGELEDKSIKIFQTEVEQEKMFKSIEFRRHVGQYQAFAICVIRVPKLKRERERDCSIKKLKFFQILLKILAYIFKKFKKP